MQSFNFTGSLPTFSSIFSSLPLTFLNTFSRISRISGKTNLNLKTNLEDQGGVENPSPEQTFVTPNSESETSFSPNPVARTVPLLLRWGIRKYFARIERYQDPAQPGIGATDGHSAPWSNTLHTGFRYFPVRFFHVLLSMERASCRWRPTVSS